MNNADYWKKRTEEKLNSQYKKADVLEQELKRQYEKALIEINKHISNFYMRFAKDNEMTYVEAVQQLRGKEFNRWRKTIDDYIREIETMEDKQLLLELNTLAMKSRINRLDSLMADIQVELTKIYSYEQTSVQDLLEDIAKDTYYQTIYEVQVGRGIGHAFGKLDKKTIEDILNHPWSGDNYSNRIWKQKDKLADTIKQELTQKFIQGKDAKTTARAVAEKMNVSYRNAATLVQTETSYVIGEATARGYETTNVEKYEILATLDTHTSDICRKEDGEVYDLKDKKIGVNYPPFHIRCRTTTVPYFEDDIGERAARDPVTGKTCYVDGNMKYKDWYKENVANNPEALAEENKVKNKASDKKQYEKYGEVLGKEVPKSFDKFQELKYNDVKEWNKLKQLYNDTNNGKVWLKAEFSSQKKFDEHIEKHLKEYGNITENDYLKIARKLLASPIKGDIEGFKSDLGFVFRYNKLTNDFAIGRPDGCISTLYKPKEGYEHWLQQIKDYKED